MQAASMCPNEVNPELSWRDYTDVEEQSARCCIRRPLLVFGEKTMLRNWTGPLNVPHQLVLFVSGMKKVFSKLSDTVSNGNPAGTADRTDPLISFCWFLNMPRVIVEE
jgi:hypothetical protein